MQNIASGNKGSEEPPIPPDEHIEEIPEAPESGRRLFRDALMFGLLGMVVAWTWTLYKQRRDNYDSDTLNEVYSVRAHIEYALNAKSMDSRIHHLNEAELHCRKALEDLGGGYLSANTANTEQPQTARQIAIEYDPQIVALHIQLGKVCYLLHKFQSAVDNYLIVLKALTQEFGYDSAELIMPCRQISDCYMQLGQYQMSELFLERALKVIEQLTNNSKGNLSEFTEYGPICQQMAVLLRKQSKWKESIDFTNKAIKSAKSILGHNHIQIAHMLLGRACCEMEMKQWQTAEKSARESLKIVDVAGFEQYAPSAQQFTNSENAQDAQQGVRNALKNMVKTNLSDKSQQEAEYEKALQTLQHEQQQRVANSISCGVSSSQQMVEMKCSILYVLGQTLLEQRRLDEAQLIFNSALVHATQLNDTTKQLLIHDQLRDIKGILAENK